MIIILIPQSLLLVFFLQQAAGANLDIIKVPNQQQQVHHSSSTSEGDWAPGTDAEQAANTKDSHQSTKPKQATSSSEISPREFLAEMTRQNPQIAKQLGALEPAQQSAALKKLYTVWRQRKQQEQKVQKTTEHSTTVNVASEVESSSMGQSSSGEPKDQNTYLLPSTMMPPSVLASLSGAASSGVTRKRPRVTGRRSGPGGSVGESPEGFLTRVLAERGYGTNLRISAEEAAYDTVPSPLQLASFGTEVVKAVHSSDTGRLGELLRCGLSANPCNQFRDSIVDLVCKRGNDAIFKTLVEHGCDLRVCDGFGRTPLHHCCWAGEFSEEIAEIIIQQDWQQLLIEDKRGQTPLEYISESLKQDWLEFLISRMDEFFPIGGKPCIVMNLKEQRADGSLPDPPQCLNVALASAVSSGKVTVEQVHSMDAQARSNYGRN